MSNKTIRVIFVISLLFLNCLNCHAQAVLAMPDSFEIYKSDQIAINHSKNKQAFLSVNSLSASNSSMVMGGDIKELPFVRKRGGWQNNKTASFVSSTTILSANFAVEADYSMYQHFGNNEAAVRNYIVNLFNAASTFYQTDTNIQILPSIVRVWTKPDPWSNLISDSDKLDGVSRYWGKNHKAVPRAGIVLLRSTAASSGIAWLNSLCSAGSDEINASTQFAYDVAVVSGVSSVNPNPWLLAHELGHTFGSQHTHCTARTLTTGFYDQCYVDGSSTCFVGTPVPSTQGTIMSYCGFRQGIGFVDNTGDPAIKNVIRATAEEYTIGNNPEGCLVPN